MMKNTIIFIVIALIGLAVLFANRCKKQTTTTTTTVTTVDQVQQPDTTPAVPDPNPADIDELLKKGVQLDSFKNVLRIVSERYQHYKQRSILLEEQLSEINNRDTGNDCNKIINAWRDKSVLHKKQNVALHNMIDTLFANLAEARKINSYTFKEKDEYQERTTEVTTVGWIPNGGYQVKGLRYFIPTTTTTKVSTERTYRNMLAGKVGAYIDGSSIVPAYGIQYATGKRIGLTGEVFYIPNNSTIMPTGGLFYRW